ncbi:MAG: leucine-rich repeat domain-containing protein [Clostridia bacterium]|nr:leucine-rich repeat domain-containing protein [Clostridia bacterium]
MKDLDVNLLELVDYTAEVEKQRENLADILTEKGIEADKSEFLNTLIPKVADIKSGGDTEYINNLVERNVNITKLPNGITTIGDYAFYYCNVLTINEISDTVTSIKTYGFCNCLGLTDISGVNVTAIGNAAFSGCKNLKTVYLPKVQYAPWYSFYNCNSLETLTLGTLTTTHNQAFQSCNKLKNITIGEGTNSTLDLHWSTELTKESIYGMIENVADMTGKTAPKMIVHDNCVAIDEEHLSMINSKNWEHNFVLLEG